MSKKVVVIKDMSAGNESIGEMWKETKIFSEDDPISDILEWVKEPYETYTKKQITLTVPDNDDIITK